MKLTIPKAKLTGTPEGRARNAICEYLMTLKNQGVLDFWVSKNMGTYDAKTKTFRSFGKYERKGVPDITGYFHASGIRLDIEVKAPHPTQTPHQRCSEEQRDFIANATKAGSVCFAAATVAEVIRQLEYPVRFTRSRLKGFQNEVKDYS